MFHFPAPEGLEPVLTVNHYPLIYGDCCRIGMRCKSNETHSEDWLHFKTMSQAMPTVSPVSVRAYIKMKPKQKKM